MQTFVAPTTGPAPAARPYRVAVRAAASGAC